MKPIQLSYLVSVLMFATVGCESKLNKLPEVTEPAKLSESNKSLHEAPADGDSNQVKLLIPIESQESRYLEAVREFADNVLKYDRDTYGPKHTPLYLSTA